MGSKKPVYLLLGPDQHRKREYLEEILKQHGIPDRPDAPERCVFFAGESRETAALVFEECITYGFFGGKKAVIVHEAEKLPKDGLKNYLDDPVASTVLVLLSDLNEKKFSAAIEKTIAACGEVKMFWQMFENRLEQWVETKAFREYGLKTPPGIGRFIVEQCGRNGELAERNLQLLANYFEDRPFSLEEAGRVVREKKELTVFDLVSAVFERDLRRSLGYLRRLLDEGEEILQVRALLERQMKLMWKYLASNGMLDARGMGLTKLPYQELRSQARLWDAVRLAKAARILAEMDLAAKSGLRPALRRLRYEHGLLRLCRC